MKDLLVCCGGLGLSLLVYWLGRSEIRWDGGFPKIECRISLTKNNGLTISDVELVVVNSDGEPSADFPVTEFDGSKLTPNQNGVFVLHQIQEGPQFGGVVEKFFGITVTGDTSPPRFHLQFYRDGQLVHTEPFNELFEDIDLPSLPREVREIETVSGPVDIDFPVLEKNITI